MCCGGKVCTLCTCLILVVIVIGFLFGFGVFKDAFHKLKDTVHIICNDNFTASTGRICGRPFIATAPPPQ